MTYWAALILTYTVNLAKPAVDFICLLNPIIQPVIPAVDTFGDALNRTLVDTFVGNIKQLVCVEKPQRSLKCVGAGN